MDLAGLHDDRAVSRHHHLAGAALGSALRYANDHWNFVDVGQRLVGQAR
jgi:hypothetical protein